ncbi:G-type lectin S-receptor-like serine/threonine-protein kinase At1g11300 [Castanea sativa]|uniref:G-type lectin S-receptor-like serine/threonine-protein kinase At1g11300 n=1 Tax=Castanea sativa TaxID=21020 RepID=UPI003F65302E
MDYKTGQNHATLFKSANRQKPLKDPSGILTISKEGNLVVLNGQVEIFWSLNVSNSVTNSSATLGYFGNLVLQVDPSGLVLWESFQHPSDSLLPKMKLSTNLRTDQRVQLTSWKSPSDPSIGSFSVGIDAPNIPEIFHWKEGHPYWRSGPWNGQVFLGIPNWNPLYRTRFIVVDDKQGTFFETFTDSDVLHLLRVVLDWQGNGLLTYWDDGKEDWEGLSRRFIKEWNRGNWTSGCVKRTPLQCERMNNSIEERKPDGFLKLEMIKVPDFAELALDVNIEEYNFTPALTAANIEIAAV